MHESGEWSGSIGMKRREGTLHRCLPATLPSLPMPLLVSAYHASLGWLEEFCASAEAPSCQSEPPKQWTEADD